MERRCMGCMELYEETLDTCPHCGYVHGTPAKEAYHILPGSLLAGRYIVGQVLGFGGFGVTYIGYDQVLQQKVAIKEYLPSEFATRMPQQEDVTIYSGEKEEQFLAGREKFVEEARRLAKFQSQSGIVQIYDCFETNRTAYIIMEYLDGVSLKEKLERDGAMTVEEAMPVIMAVIGALKSVHAAGILHRDISPDNIYLLKNGQTKLLDFGAARFATTKHSRSLSVIIKPGFAPVEQYRSRGDQGPWTDVYALAATFYNMLTGQVPEDAMERAAQDTLKEPSKLGVKISPSLEAALMNALNVQIENRTRTINRFEQDLLASDVKRVVEKKRKEDLGKWPFWIKVLIGVGIAAVTALAVVLVALPQRVLTPSAPTTEAGKTRVPNMVNLSFDDARKLAGEAGLEVLIGDKDYDDQVPENKVLRQEIKHGELAEAGATIQLTISAGIRKTYVPNVIGMESEAARKLLDEAGLIPVTEEKEYRAAPGTVAEQSMEPEQECTTGTEIKIIISKGIGGGDSAQTVAMADLTGMDYDEAAQLLLQNYLYLVKAEARYDDNVPEGGIISQEVAVGTMVNQNSNVRVAVSLGKELIRVPDLQYKTEAEAMELLSAAGLEGSVTREASRDVAAGSVIRQTQEAGSQVEKGSAVAFVVSDGAPKETKPETTADRQTTARQTEQTAPQAPTAAEQAQTAAETTTTAPAETTTTADDGNADLIKLLEEHDKQNR
ncbi:MAG: PASTA domain-containing protein [Enterocloster asparagiformis]|nr:PASTA domain-containing protein [Enterocloster asparagiformis]